MKIDEKFATKVMKRVNGGQKTVYLQKISDMKHILALMALATATVATAAGHIQVADTLNGSEIYPATVHSYIITVPDGYDGTTPAALYVGLDGILCNAPAVLDSLMADGTLPPTVGVFLQPGFVPGETTAIRYNRSNEFDATDGRFASFLETELLPAVDGRTLDDGRTIHLTADPSRRMIFGLSSGGIAAFNAAWHRPELFGKVYSGCGTFVPMRGGNELEAIVRKHEPKPLKIFLQDGYTDSWNPIFGSWYEHNRMLASALQFAGYDCAFDWAEGGHSVVRTSAIFPDVMRWMWGPDSTGTTGNGLLAKILVPDAGWVACAAPACPVPTGSAVYPDSTMRVDAVPASNWLNQTLIGADGEPYATQRFYWLHSYDNDPVGASGMAFDGDGYLWVATRDGLQVLDQNGRVRAIIALPRDIDGTAAAVTVGDGGVTVVGPDGRAYSRRFNIAAPTPGVRPRSQGAA